MGTIGPEPQPVEKENKVPPGQARRVPAVKGRHAIIQPTMCKHNMIKSSLLSLLQENYVPSTHTPQGTQRPQSSQRSATRQMTIAQSPLNVIQPKSVRRGSFTMSPARSLNYTPGPAYLLEDVKRLTIDKGGSAAIDVRRQLLFSDLEAPSPQVRPSRLQNLVSRHDSETTVGKKANKSRLRRL